MKKLMFVVASLALASIAMAADGTETKFSGELRGRYLMADNPSMAPDATADGSSGWMQRTKMGVTFSKGEDLMGQFTFMHNANWGDAANGGAANGGVAAGTSDVWASEAWGFWKATDNFSLRIGRGGFQIADGSVVGTNDWAEMPKAFEGVLGTWYTEFANIHGFGVKGVDSTGAVGTDTPEANFYGLSFDVKNLPEALKMANVHFLQINSHDVIAAGVMTNTLRYGLTLGGGLNNFDYRATYAGYSGEAKMGATSTDMTGSMFDVEAGYTLPDYMKWHFGVLYHMDSGEDADASKTTQYNPFHYNEHENAGLMDVIAWGNSTYIKVGTSIAPWENSTIGLDYYMFSLSEEADTVNYQTAGYGAARNATLSDAVGSEIDFYATKTYANGFSAGLRYGVFTPGDYYVDTAEAASQFMLEGKFTF